MGELGDILVTDGGLTSCHGVARGMRVVLGNSNVTVVMMGG